MKKRKTTPPAHLSDEAKRLWREILRDFEVDDVAGRLLLSEALTAYDEVKLVRAILAKDGPVITDKFNQKKQHPATLILRDSRNLMLRCLKALNLDIAPGQPLQ